MSFNVELVRPTCSACGLAGEGWLWSNMTYNLRPMFERAGFWEMLQSAREATVTARELSPLLRAGLADMRENPHDYRHMNPENGWGDSIGAQAFTEALLTACENMPEAEVRFRG